MAQLRFGSAGVTAREIDLSAPIKQAPTGIPAGVIGTATRGPAFVPITVGLLDDFFAKFGATDGKKFGPLAVVEWLRNAGSVTYIRVMGVGDGRKRVTDGNTAGTVTNAGFVVGEEQPRESDGTLFRNDYANLGGPLGRTFMLGCLMSESAGSTVFSSAGLHSSGQDATALPIIRGVLMTPSGVIARLSSSYTADSVAPGSTDVADDSTAKGGLTGSVVLLDDGTAKQEFVVLLNGHKGIDPLYPNVLTASFDMTAPNYFPNVFNTDPFNMQRAGHYLYAHYDVHPATAVVTGSGDVITGSATGSYVGGIEEIAFLTTSSLGRNVGSSTVPNYENFEDRFSYAKTPWLTSQRFGGTRYNLFRLHALDAGKDVSSQYKFSIENLVNSTDPNNKYGSFDLVIREFTDRDTDQRPAEAWRGLTLDPNSDRYIAKVVGDAYGFYDFDRTESEQKLVVEGQYENQSNIVRVEVSTDIENATVDPTALPVGVRGAAHLVTSGSAPLTAAGDYSWVKNAVTPPVPFRTNITQGSGAKQSVQPQYYWGYQFEHVTSLSTPNGSTLRNKSMNSHSKFYPDFMTNTINFVVGENNGVVDTVENGILDADRFNIGLFTLENVRVVTSSAGTADSNSWDQASYIRNGNINADDSAKTRRLETKDFTQSNRRFLKFNFFMQGGFDGVNSFDRDEVEINNNAVRSDVDDESRGQNLGPNVRAFTKAIDIMSNVVATDVQLLAMPGVRTPLVTNYALEQTETRFDAMYLMDIEEKDTQGNLVRSGTQPISVQLTANDFASRALDNTFGAAYFPDVLMTDPNTKTNLFVPPSVAVLGAMALNDAVGHPWFAPAGFTRGALATALEAKVQLKKENMDALYDVNINPLTAFPGNATSGTNPRGGVIVWGQRTLQQAASALDRVNVRRLLIDIRRQVRTIANTIVFEPNRGATLAKFSAAVTPRLQRVQALSGLERFRVVIDSSTTTQADIENNTIRGKIFVQPTKTVEFVSLDFVVSNRLQQVQ